MFRRSLALILAVAAATQPAFAQEIPPLQQVRAARTLFDLGMANREPLYVLAAARLRKSVDMQAADRAPDGGTAADGSPMGWREMLDAAAPMIAGDPALQNIAEDIAAESSKGVQTGPVYSIVDIRAGGKDVYPKLPFAGGQYAEIYVEGAPGTDLNLLVHDDQGRLVCSDTDISSIAYCGWRPATTGGFAITVVNEGGTGGRYSLMTN